MFSATELGSVMRSPLFQDDLRTVHEGLSKRRLGQGQLFANAVNARLSYFVEAVLASAPQWDANERAQICTTAAEIAELLATEESNIPSIKLRSALLYELAGLPAISQSLAATDNLPPAIKPFLARTEGFGPLSLEYPRTAPELPSELDHIAEAAMSSDSYYLARYLQGESLPFSPSASTIAAELSKELAIGYTASELQAIATVFQQRANSGTRTRADDELFTSLKRSLFPSELWPAQLQAVEGGLLAEGIQSWGLAAPTGTGKTFLTHLLIIDTLRKRPQDKVLYVAPSRALVHEVATNLGRALEPLAYKVIAVTPQLLQLDEEEASEVDEASVIVLTPEKADMLLRLGLSVFRELSLVVIDEVHHLESNTRGILLEMYLWRLKSLVGTRARFVFLSAVTPNMQSITRWISSNSQSVTVKQRPTRMRAGVYRITGTGGVKPGTVQYTDGVSLPLVDIPETGVRRQLVQLGAAMAKAGSVLVVAKGKRECEILAATLLGWLRENNTLRPIQRNETMDRLDSRLEREMYPDVELRKLATNRIAYHHAGLPPRVRIALEAAIKEGLIDYVFATTTLAEGVNFPFATVIVQSLALREAPQPGRAGGYQPVTPRVFWNLAGRAGRPGHDREGQVILFEPTVGLDKISYVLGDYLNAELTANVPVRGALAESIEEIAQEIRDDQLTMQDLSSAALPQSVSRRVRGAVNLIRVSLLHARASKLVKSYEEILEGTFAKQMLDSSAMNTAKELFATQDRLIDEFFRQRNAPSPEIAAELGLSIETLTALRTWVLSLADWQIRNLQKLFWGGSINLDQAKYVIGPVARHMAELEGPKLGGFLSEVILLWLSGIPFAALRARLTGNLRSSTIEDLIALVYSRIQFLLPWGLYAADRLIESEAQERGITYLNDLRSLAYLVDAGVSSFDAMRLVHFEFERTDAERLATAYHAEGGIKTGMDIGPWVASKSIDIIGAIVKGPDSRRLDYDLEERLSAIRRPESS
jgi:superfamily II DNA/RNA helicase